MSTETINIPQAGNGIAEAMKSAVETVKDAPKRKGSNARPASSVGPLTNDEMAEVIRHGQQFEARVTDERFVTAVSEFAADELKDGERKLLLGQFVLAFMAAAAAVQEALLTALAALHKVTVPDVTLGTARRRLAAVLYAKHPFYLAASEAGKDTRGEIRLSKAQALAAGMIKAEKAEVQAKADEALGIPQLELAGPESASVPTAPKSAKGVFVALFALFAPQYPENATDEQKAEANKKAETDRLDLRNWFARMNYDAKWITKAWTEAADTARGVTKETAKAETKQ